MNALVYQGNKTLAFQEEVNPTTTNNEVLIQVTAAGICGSDMHAFLGHDERRVPPIILGHEIAGIVASGEDKGKHVTVNPLISCHNCTYCLEGRANLCPNRTMLGMSRAGGFAEYVTAPTGNLIFIDEPLSPEKIALAEPAANVIHALRLVQNTLWRPLPEAKTLIIGGGAIGMLCALFLKAYGVADITLSETSSLRRSNYESMDSITLHNPIEAKLDANSFDLVLDVVGIEPTRQTSIEVIKAGGVIMHIGLGNGAGQMDARKLTLAEISFLGSYAYTMSDMQQAIKFLSNGSLGSLDWLMTMPLSDGQAAFDALLAGEIASPKIVLIP